MRPHGTPAELERRRTLAVERYGGGYDPAEIAEFLGVSERSVWRWLAADRAGTLGARPAAGRPPKLSPPQWRVLLRWSRERPTDLGFPTDLWTAARLARLAREVWGVEYHPGHLAARLRAAGQSPQKPQRVPRERDQGAIDAWCAADWPRIQKTSASGRPTSC